MGARGIEPPSRSETSLGDLKKPGPLANRLDKVGERISVGTGCISAAANPVAVMLG